MKDQRFAVIGLGRFGRDLARELSAQGAEVIAIDRQRDLVEKMRDEVTVAVCLDSTDEDALRAQGVHEVDVAIIGIGDNFEASALTVSILAGHRIKRIICRAENEVQAEILRRIGANEIAYPEGESALRWAHRLMVRAVTQYIELGEKHSIVYVPAPDRFVGKTPQQLALRREMGINLIAIERPLPTEEEEREESDSASAPRRAEDVAAQTFIIVPQADTTVEEGDVLVLVGANEAINAIARE